MTEIVRSFCPQCGARDAAMVIPGVPFSVMCSKCGISMVRESGAPSLSPIPPTDFVQVPIEDVKPGDVARCNGREFPVQDQYAHQPWRVVIGSEDFYPNEPEFFEVLSFTFWRKVKREPRTFEVQPSSVDVEYDSSRMVSPVTKFQVTLPGAYWGLNSRFRITEILDGEDGSGV